MSEKLSAICASILFAVIPVMLVYLVKSAGRKGFTAYGSSRRPDYR
jgi:hypothetical protein